MTRASHDRLPYALYAFAAGMAVAATALGVWAWRFNTRLADELSRAARAQSEVISRDFAEEFQARHMTATEPVLGFLRERRVWEPGLSDSLLQRVAAYAECRCRPANVAHGAFVWRSSAPDEMEVRSLDPRAADAMRRRIIGLFQTFPGVGTEVITLKADADGNEIYAIVAFRRFADQSTRAAGFMGDLDVLGREFLEPVANHVSVARLGKANAKVVSWRVIRPNGDTLVRIGPLDPEQPATTNAFWRPRFVADSGLDISFLTTRATVAQSSVIVTTPGEADPRRTPWLVIAQVSPASMAALLYGSQGMARMIVPLLLGTCLALGVAMMLMARRLVHHVREREAFATAVAHDLRTPLTQILLHAESMQLSRPTEETRREGARVIVREARRLVHMVENALTFVRGRRSPPRLAFAVVDLARVVDDVLTAFAPTTQRAQMRVSAELTPGLRASIDADALAQVLGNLLENAVRFGPAGQVIAVRVHEDADGACIEVEDEGPGIPPEERESIFRPFVRGRESGGTGIGLAVARQLVELLNGRIDVRDGRVGARFVIVLPLTGAPAATDDVREPEGFLA